MIAIDDTDDLRHNNSSRAPVVAGFPALNTKSNDVDSMPVKIIPVGTRFGKLVIIGVGNPKTASNGDRYSQSLCLCDCGNRKEIPNGPLKSGATVSCGCYHSQMMRSRATHGYNRAGQRHPIYSVWASMLRRCQNLKNPKYSDYGGRGITVCERWQTFSNFLEDMLPGFRRDLTIERVDNNKGYSKENCKWETRRGQMLNRRSARLVSFGGETLNLSVWSERTGIAFSTLKARLGHLGWSVEEALTTAAHKKQCTPSACSTIVS
jgi:hypothetical protein